MFSGICERYFGAVFEKSMSFPTTIVSPLNGGAALIGKRGRKTPKLSDASIREMTRNTAAHFMLSGSYQKDRVTASKFLRFPLPLVVIFPATTI
jgi:hypothetical protein